MIKDLTPLAKMLSCVVLTLVAALLLVIVRYTTPIVFGVGVWYGVALTYVLTRKTSYRGEE